MKNKRVKVISQYDYVKAGAEFQPFIRETDYRLRTDEYIIVHLDGVNFTSSYYKKMSDSDRKLVLNCLMMVGKRLCNEIISTRICYVCSDEISLVLSGDDLSSNFHNRISKIISYIVSKATFFFLNELEIICRRNTGIAELKNNPFFSAKAYNLPKEKIEHYLKWRLLACKKMIFDKHQDYQKKEDWEKFGFLIIKNNQGNWVENSLDFSNKKIQKQPQNDCFQVV